MNSTMTLNCLNKHRRKTASFVLLWLLLSGQLFCTAHAGFGVEPDIEAVEQPVMTCCHGGSNKAASSPRLNTSCCDSLCCENPSNFCCGNAKHGTADACDTDFSDPVLTLAFVCDDLSAAPLYSLSALPLWAEDIWLRRSDPPIHLRNCTFLD